MKTKISPEIRKHQWDVLDVLIEGCQIIGFDWRYRYLNDVAAKHGSLSKEELLGHTMMEMYPGIENTEMFAKLRQCMEEHIPQRMENEFTFPDGTKSWYELNMEPVNEGVLILSWDITERKQTEEKLRNLNEMLLTIRKINQLIVEADDEAELLRQVCETLVDGRNYKVAWIGFISESSYDVLPVAHAGLEADYLSSVKITLDDSGYGQGTTGNAIKTRRASIMRDITNDKRYWPWLEQAIKRGNAASEAFPLIVEDRVIGALNVYSGKPDAFDEAETGLLMELAGDIALGIEKIRQRTERRQMEDELKIRAQFLDTAMDSICAYDFNGNFIYANEVAYKSRGYDKSEFMAMNRRELATPEQSKLFDLRLKKLQKKGKIVFESEHLHKDGTVIPVEIHARLIEIDGKNVVTSVSRDITERKEAEQKLEKSSDKLRKILEDTVQAIAATSEMRDPYTAGHQKRVTQLACALAKEMNLSEEQIEGLRVAGTLHDIGKVYVPAEILSKPGQLTEFEFGIIKTHPRAGYEILKSIEFPWPVAQIILQHHERLDGSGYPSGLSGKDILLEARILGIADVVEAMSSHRPYRPGMGIKETLEEISRSGGGLFGPEIVDCCISLFYDKGFKFEEKIKIE